MAGNQSSWSDDLLTKQRSIRKRWENTEALAKESVTKIDPNKSSSVEYLNRLRQIFRLERNAALDRKLVLTELQDTLFLSMLSADSTELLLSTPSLATLLPPPTAVSQISANLRPLHETAERDRVWRHWQGTVRPRPQTQRLLWSCYQQLAVQWLTQFAKEKIEIVQHLSSRKLEPIMSFCRDKLEEFESFCQMAALFMIYLPNKSTIGNSDLDYSASKHLMRTGCLDTAFDWQACRTAVAGDLFGLVTLALSQYSSFLPQLHSNLMGSIFQNHRPAMHQASRWSWSDAFLQQTQRKRDEHKIAVPDVLPSKDTTTRRGSIMDPPPQALFEHPSLVSSVTTDTLPFEIIYRHQRTVQAQIEHKLQAWQQGVFSIEEDSIKNADALNKVSMFLTVRRLRFNSTVEELCRLD